MKEITVKTQEEFDKVKDQKEETRLSIESSIDALLYVRSVPKNCNVVARGSSHVEAWGSSHVVARGSSHVVARDSSHVVARDSSHVEAWGSSHVEAWGSSHVVAWGSSHVEAWERTTITNRSKDSETKLHGKALLQEASEDLSFPSLKEWFVFWDINPIKGKVRMYKAVKPDLTDFYTGKIHYEVGKTIACPDWLDDWQEECGHGFHCSPQLFLTDNYAQGKDHVHIAVEVSVKDLRLPKDGIMSMADKIRCCKLTVLEILKQEV